MYNEDDRTYFNPGDVVEIKQNLDYKPKMVVKSVDKVENPGTDKKPLRLLGVTCFWFSTDGKLQTERFNTKDLSHCE